MATYLELYSLTTDTTLRQKLTVAILVACEAIRVEANNTPFHSNRIAWAQQAITNAEGEANKAIGLLLAANKALTVAQINGVTDTVIQSSLDALINTLTGLN